MWENRTKLSKLLREKLQILLDIALGSSIQIIGVLKIYVRYK